MIAFNKLKINNFRGIDNLELNKFKQFNIIIGNNDTGKTSILEALYININPGNPNLPLTANAHRGIVSLDNQQFWKSFYKNYDIHQPIEFESKLFNKQDLQLKVTPILAPGPLIKDSLALDIPNQNTSISQQVQGLKFHLTYKADSGKSQIYNTEIRIDLNNPQNPLKTKLDESWKQVLDGFYLSIQNTYGSDLAKRVGELITLKQEKELVEVLQEIEPRIKDIALDGSSRVVVDIEGLPQRILINSLGEGLYRIANIVSLIYRAANGVVLVDEIETGLDRTSKRKLWKAIFKTALKNKVQIFVTTHSLEIIDTFYETVTEQKEQKNMCMIRLERKTDRSIKTIYFDYQQLELAREQGWEIR